MEPVSLSGRIEQDAAIFTNTLINHGFAYLFIPPQFISQQLVNDMKRVTKEFFGLPKSEKQTLKRSSTNSRGWFDDEFTKNHKDWKEAFDFGFPNPSPIDGENQWPSEKKFHDISMQYYDSLRALSEYLMKLISIGLGFDDETALLKYAGESHSSFLRLNFYPKCPRSTEFGIRPHTDAGLLTILLQDDHVTSLQIDTSRYHSSSSDSGWTSVVPKPDTFIINSGDMLEILSNARILAPPHRVLTQTGKERYSWAFFYNPCYSATITPLVSESSGKVVSRFRPVDWGEFRLARFQGDYADVGEEIQIRQFMEDTDK